MPRWLKLEPALVGSAVAAVYVAAAMLYRALGHTGVFQPDLLVAAVGGLYGLWTRAQVTPLALPRDNAGKPLTAVVTPPPVPLVSPAPAPNSK